MCNLRRYFSGVSEAAVKQAASIQRQTATPGGGSVNHSLNYIHLCQERDVTNFVVNQCEPQFRLDNGVGQQQVLHSLQFLFAFLGRRIVLSSHWEILEKLQHAHSCS